MILAGRLSFLLEVLSVYITCVFAIFKGLFIALPRARSVFRRSLPNGPADSLAFFRCKHLRLGTIRLAYG